MPARAPLAAHVDVWRVDLDGLPPPGEAALEALDGDERRRHAAYLAPEAARIFATTRLALRRLIAVRTRQAPRRVRLALDAHGKPYAPDCPGLSFNVSHCGTGALVAFCGAGSVGVDIETASGTPPPEPFGPMVCTEAELRWLRAHPRAAGPALERLWCRKEAIAKAWGTGLKDGMSRIETSDPGLTRGVLEADHLPRTVWRDLDLPPPHLAALAVASPAATCIDVELRSFNDLFPGAADDH